MNIRNLTDNELLQKISVDLPELADRIEAMVIEARTEARTVEFEYEALESTNYIVIGQTFVAESIVKPADLTLETLNSTSTRIRLLCDPGIIPGLYTRSEGSNRFVMEITNVF